MNDHIEADLINTDEDGDSFDTGRAGCLRDQYQIYLACADNGKGGDVTRAGRPLLTFEEWLSC
ncbi:MAG: hypothetical protein U7M05_11650 [Candidatus Igneacidithiobacillus chanchocoensis]